MNPFDYLLLAHLIGDYPLQTSWMAKNKAAHWLPLVTHSFVYTVVIGLISLLGFGGLSLWQLFMIFLGHVLLDRRKFIAWWVKKIMRTNLSENLWLSIMVDQVFHLTLLVLVLRLPL